MKILLTADVHGNHEALQALLAACPAFDRLVCLGDIVGYYPQVNEVMATLRAHEAIGVRGNHDEMLLTGNYAGVSEPVRFGLEVAHAELDPKHCEWLAALPLTLALELDGKRLFFVHGSPWNPLEEYIYPDSPKLPLLAELPYDILAWGHTHREVLVQNGSRWLINPGSVGQSRSHRGLACGVLLCTETMTAQPLQIAYDPAPLIRACEDRGAGDWVAKSLGRVT